MKFNFFKDPVNEEWVEWFGWTLASCDKRWCLSIIAFKYCLNIEL